MKYTRKNKGITLIALIITIIIILVLAIVSINIIINVNVVEKAKYGVDKYSEQEEYEKVQRAIVGAKFEILGTELNQDAFNKNLKTEFGENNYNLEFENEKFELRINKSGRIYSIKKTGEIISINQENISSNNENNNNSNNVEGNTTVYVTASDINSNPSGYYGKNVNYIPSVKNQTTTNYENVSGWKIFYADSNNIYLISENFIKADLIPAVNGHRPMYVSDGNSPKIKFNNDNLRNVYSGGSSNVNSAAIGWLDQFYNGGFSSTEANMAVTAYLMDVNVWNEFSISNKTDYAIGSPTLQMIAASYNALYGTSNNPYPIATRVPNKIGYAVNPENEEVGSDNNYKSGLDRTNTLYNADSSTVLWLASPACGVYDWGGYKLMNLFPGDTNSGAGVGCDDLYNADNNGLRPVVKLNSNVKLSLTDGQTVYVWKIKIL